MSDKQYQQTTTYKSPPAHTASDVQGAHAIGLGNIHPVHIGGDVWTTHAHGQQVDREYRMRHVGFIADQLRDALSGGYQREVCEEWKRAKSLGDSGIRAFLAARGMDGEAELAVFKKRMGMNGLFGLGFLGL